MSYTSGALADTEINETKFRTQSKNKHDKGAYTAAATGTTPLVPDPFENYTPEVDADTDASSETGVAQADCGLCLAGHLTVQLVLQHLWYLTVPLQWLESLFLSLTVYGIREVLLTDPFAVVAGFVLGTGLGYGLFEPLARHDFHPACTTYLSLLAWCAGQLLVLSLAASKMVNLQVVQEGPCGTCGSSDFDSRRSSWLTGLGSAGYAGLLVGLLLVFGSVAFDPVTESELVLVGEGRAQEREQWVWCRASEEWPAEVVYVLVFVLAMLAAVVAKPSVSATEAVTETDPQEEQERQNHVR